MAQTQAALSNSRGCTAVPWAPHRQVGRVFDASALAPQVHSLKLALEGVEKERDFYFGKLREIELLCQEQGQESDSLVQRLMEVLYASDEHVSGRAQEWGRRG